LVCVHCWGVFTWEYPSWAKSLISPNARTPIIQEIDAVRGIKGTGEGILASQLYIIKRNFLLLQQGRPAARAPFAATTTRPDGDGSGTHRAATGSVGSGSGTQSAMTAPDVTLRSTAVEMIAQLR